MCKMCKKDVNSLREQLLRKLTLKMHNLHKSSKIKGFETLNVHFCFDEIRKMPPPSVGAKEKGERKRMKNYCIFCNAYVVRLGI